MLFKGLCSYITITLLYHHYNAYEKNERKEEREKGGEES